MNLLKKSCATLVAVALCAGLCSTAGALDFDVAYHWSRDSVNTLMENGLINGYPDGRFRPDHNLSREEAASMFYTLLTKLPPKQPETEPEPSEPAPSEQPDNVQMPEVVQTDNQMQEEAEPAPEDAEQEQTDSTEAENEAESNQGKNEENPTDSDMTENTEKTADPELNADTEEESSTETDSSEEIEDAKEDSSVEVSSIEDQVADESATPDQTDTVEPETPAAPTPVNFWDTQGRWSDTAVTYLCTYGILSGYTDGAFHPEDAMTRGSFAVMIANSPYVQGRTPTQAVPSFPDLEGSYAKDAAQLLCSLGIMSGYQDGTFRPDAAMTRAEAATVLCNVSGLEIIPANRDLPTSVVIDTPYISQVYPVSAPVGCEPTSLLMGLKAKGYAQDVDLRTFLDNLPHHSSNPAKGFVGSPYTPSQTLRTTIYPNKLAEYGQQYGDVVDISGSSPAELQSEILAGHPVVAYVTLYWKKPYYRNFNIEGEIQSLLRNNHAVLVCGYDTQTNYYYIADPYNINAPGRDYFYWIDGDTFDSLYLVRRHAVAVQ